MKALLVHRNFIVASLLALIAVLCWSGNFVVGRSIAGQIPPVHLSFWRWVLASLLLCPVYCSMSPAAWRAVRSGFWVLCALGLTGAVMFQTMVYIGLQYTNASNAVLLNAFNPIAVMVFVWLLFGERARLRQLVGICISFVGVVILITRGDWMALSAMRFNLGDLWVLGAVIIWGVYSVLLKFKPADLPAMAVVWATAISGALLLLPIYIYTLCQGQSFTLSWATLGAIGYVSIFASIVAFSAFNGAVARIGPTRTSYFLHLLPVFGALLAALVLDEELARYHLLGFGCTLLGVVLATTARLK